MVFTGVYFVEEGVKLGDSEMCLYEVNTGSVGWEFTTELISVVWLGVGLGQWLRRLVRLWLWRWARLWLFISIVFKSA